MQPQHSLSILHHHRGAQFVFYQLCSITVTSIYLCEILVLFYLSFFFNPGFRFQVKLCNIPNWALYSKKVS